MTGLRLAGSGFPFSVTLPIPAQISTAAEAIPPWGPRGALPIPWQTREGRRGLQALLGLHALKKDSKILNEVII